MRHYGEQIQPVDNSEVQELRLETLKDRQQDLRSMMELAVSVRRMQIVLGVMSAVELVHIIWSAVR